MDQKFLLLLVLFMGINQFNAQENSQIVIGEKHQLHSTILEEDREYWISLPDSYDNENSSYKKYPILVILDGNIHFQSISGMVNYMSSDRYRSWKIPEMIVVGIQNVDRRRDYTPDKIVTVRENNSGGGKKFLRFLEEELIPELDQNYRTSDYRILFGHSLGGLLTTHAYLQPTSAFKAFLAIDPSFGTWDSAVMDQKLANFSPESFQRYLYIATANWGKRNITNRDRHVRFFESLHRLSEEEFPVQLEYFENENHASVPPIAFYKGISAIFDGYGITYREVTNPKQLQEHFTEISNRLSSEFLPPENLVNQLGYNKLRSNNEAEKALALEFFRMNTQNYPESYNAFDSLAEAYANFGNSEKALENYQQSLQLNPENEHARMQIEKLKK